MKKSILISLFTAIFSAMLGMGIVSPLLPVYAQEYGASGFVIGLIFASFSLSRTVVLPIVGTLSDRRGRKIFITLGLLLFSATSVGYVLAVNLKQIMAARLLQGVASAMVIPVALAYMGDITPKGKEGSFMGVFNIFFFGGLGAGPIVGGVVKDLFGIKASFASMGVVSLIGFVLTLLLLPERKAMSKESRTGSWSLRQLLSHRPLKGLYLFRFMYSIGIGMFWTFLPLFADNVLELSGSRIGVLVSLNILVATVLQPIFGKLADRISKVAMVCVGGGLAAAAYFVIPVTTTFMQIFWASILLGVSGGISMPALTAIAVQEGRRVEAMGRIMSMFVLCHSLGMLVGPIFAGVVAEAVSVPCVFLAGAILKVLGVGGFAWGSRRSGKGG